MSSSGVQPNCSADNCHMQGKHQVRISIWGTAYSSLKNKKRVFTSQRDTFNYRKHSKTPDKTSKYPFFTTLESEYRKGNGDLKHNTRIRYVSSSLFLFQLEQSPLCISSFLPFFPSMKKVQRVMTVADKLLCRDVSPSSLPTRFCRAKLQPCHPEVIRCTAVCACPVRVQIFLCTKEPQKQKSRPVSQHLPTPEHSSGVGTIYSQIYSLKETREDFALCFIMPLFRSN